MSMPPIILRRLRGEFRARGGLPTKHGTPAGLRQKRLRAKRAREAAARAAAIKAGMVPPVSGGAAAGGTGLGIAMSDVMGGGGDGTMPPHSPIVFDGVVTRYCVFTLIFSIDVMLKLL